MFKTRLSDAARSTSKYSGLIDNLMEIPAKAVVTPFVYFRVEYFLMGLKGFDWAISTEVDN